MRLSRETVEVDGVAASYLTAGSGPPVLLLHGTYWSRVWLPVIDLLAGFGLRPIAVDLPGCGRSLGELDLESARVPALATWVERFADALELETWAGVAGHDIGGAIAQHLCVRGGRCVERLALVNSVTYSSWPVPGVARFRDPAVVAQVGVEELLEQRRQALEKALARPLSNAELVEYLSPWTIERVARSWMALAGAADSRYTLELVDELRASVVPKLLVWGEDDSFQRIEYAERFAAEMPGTDLVRIGGAGHVPMENRPKAVARTLGRFFAPAG